MKPRCPGAKTPGHFTGFVCVLDDGHDGFCQPYQAPSVDEYRTILSMLAELDALRAIVESGRDLDAETVAGVQAARDDLRGLAGKGAT